MIREKGGRYVMKTRICIATILTSAILMGLTGCQANEPDMNQENTGGLNVTDIPAEALNSEAGLPETGSLRPLYDDLYADCVNENGRYYLLDSETPLKDGSGAFRLMYMDFETQQEIYLCSNSSCNHDTRDCAAVFPMDEIAYACRLFLYNDSLYLLSAEYDDSGSITMQMMSDPSGSPAPEQASTLYRMNLDGTGREKVYEFEAGLTTESNIILGDDTGIYLVTKKLSTEQLNHTATRRTASERKLVRLSPSDWKTEIIYEFDPTEGDTQWDILGCFDSSLVLNRIVFDHELSTDEILDDDAYIDAYNHSKTEIAILNLTDHSIQTVYSLPNDPLNSYVQQGHMLYASIEGEDCVRQIDLITGEVSVLADLKENYIQYCFADVLLCTGWDSHSVMHFVNRTDGTVSDSRLQNLSLGWPLEFHGERKDDFLVVYDYEAIPHEDESYEITQYKFALIAKQDLYTGNANYRPITMIEKGE